jgi:thioester reductase-like protein
MSDKNSILVTGGTGFLGRHFVYRALLQGQRIVALVRGASTLAARKRILDLLEDAATTCSGAFSASELGELLRVMTGDISLPHCGLGEGTADKLYGQIDEVWHIAANLRFEPCFASEIRLQNVVGTANALALAQRIGVRRFVYVSTAYTAGKRSGLIAEAAQPADTEFNNLYESTKAESERLVETTCTSRGMEFAILRPSIIVGPVATKGTGGSATGLYGFMRELRRLRRLLIRRAEPTIISADPNTPINLIPVDSVVASMLDLRAQDFERRNFHHLVNPRPPTAREIMPVICGSVGTPHFRLEPDYRPQNPVEQLFARRMSFYGGYFLFPKVFEQARPSQVDLTLSDIESYLREALKRPEPQP